VDALAVVTRRWGKGAVPTKLAPPKPPPTSLASSFTPSSSLSSPSSLEHTYPLSQNHPLDQSLGGVRNKKQTTAAAAASSTKATAGGRRRAGSGSGARWGHGGDLDGSLAHHYAVNALVTLTTLGAPSGKHQGSVARSGAGYALSLRLGSLRRLAKQRHSSDYLQETSMAGISDVLRLAYADGSSRSKQPPQQDQVLQQDLKSQGQY